MPNYKALYIDEELHNQVKAFTALKGKTIREWLEPLLRNQIQEGQTLKERAALYDIHPPASP